jgi:type III secretion system FlhB-like substrate exporter
LARPNSNWKRRYDIAKKNLKHIVAKGDEQIAYDILEQAYIAGIESEKTRIRLTLGLGVEGRDYGI